MSAEQLVRSLSLAAFPRRRSRGFLCVGVCQPDEALCDHSCSKGGSDWGEVWQVGIDAGAKYMAAWEKV